MIANGVKWRLIINGDLEHAFPLHTSSCLIGRSADCDVVLKPDDISRKHARLSLRGSRWTVEDLGSKNGVRINGEKIRPGQTYELLGDDELTLSSSVSLRIESFGSLSEDRPKGEKSDLCMPVDIERDKSGGGSLSTAKTQEDMILAFLPVVDSIERGIETFSGTLDDPYLLGLRQIRKQALEQLEKMGATQIPAEGRTFDPYFHNAVSHVTDSRLPQNTVSKVIVAGYLFNGRVLRFASVIVAN